MRGKDHLVNRLMTLMKPRISEDEAMAFLARYSIPEFAEWLIKGRLDPNASTATLEQNLTMWSVLYVGSVMMKSAEYRELWISHHKAWVEVGRYELEVAAIAGKVHNQNYR